MNRTVWQQDVLGSIADALQLTELLAAQEVNVHVDTLLHRRNLREDTSDVQEGFDVTLA